MTEDTKHLADAGALVITVGSLADVLPSIAAVVSIIWGAIWFYETKTVQKLLGRNNREVD